MQLLDESCVKHTIIAYIPSSQRFGADYLWW